MFITVQSFDDYDDDLVATYSLMDEKGEHQPDGESLYGVLMTEKRVGVKFTCTGLDLYTEPPEIVIPWEFLQ